MHNDIADKHIRGTVLARFKRVNRDSHRGGSARRDMK